MSSIRILFPAQYHSWIDNTTALILSHFALCRGYHLNASWYKEMCKTIVCELGLETPSLVNYPDGPGLSHVQPRLQDRQNQRTTDANCHLTVAWVTLHGPALYHLWKPNGYYFIHIKRRYCLHRTILSASVNYIVAVTYVLRTLSIIHKIPTLAMF